MKKIILLFNLLCCIFSYAQEKLLHDLDGDKLVDTVFLNIENSQIIAKLSTTGFNETKSKEMELLGDQNSIRKTKNGFELSSSFMRAGNACQFRYNIVAKKIQLIGMSCYEFGNAANDGSGEGSVNLLNNTYIGEWNSYDEKKQVLIKLPKITQRMVLGKIYLETFNSKVIDDFLDKSAVLYDSQKNSKTRK